MKRESEALCLKSATTLSVFNKDHSLSLTLTRYFLLPKHKHKNIALVDRRGYCKKKK